MGKVTRAVRIDTEEEMFRDSAPEDPKVGGRQGAAILKGAWEGKASEVEEINLGAGENGPVKRGLRQFRGQWPEPSP